MGGEVMVVKYGNRWYVKKVNTYGDVRATIRSGVKYTNYIVAMEHARDLNISNRCRTAVKYIDYIGDDLPFEKIL